MPHEHANRSHCRCTHLLVRPPSVRTVKHMKEHRTLDLPDRLDHASAADLHRVAHWPTNRDELKAWCRLQLPWHPSRRTVSNHMRRTPDVIRLVYTPPGSSLPVAYGQLTATDIAGGCWRLGLLIVAPTFRRQGHGRAALQRLCQFTFEQLEAERLEVLVAADNHPARHLYDTEGFSFEGELQQAQIHDGEQHDLHLMARTADVQLAVA